MAMASSETQELIECSFGFAQAAREEGYARFEAAIAPVLKGFADTLPIKNRIATDRIAHVLASAVHGLKATATTTAELRQLIAELLTLSLGVPGHAPS